MEIKNKTAYTHDCIIEFNKTFRRKTRRLINILCLIAIGALVFFLFSQCLLFLMGEDPYLSPTIIAEMIVLLIIYIGYSTVVPITVKRTVRRSRRKSFSLPSVKPDLETMWAALGARNR